MSYVAGVWRCRYFWLSLVKMDLRIRYRGSLLGIGWSLLQPLAMTVILCAAFARIFKAEITYFGPFLMVGLAFWNYLVNVAIQGCHCFKQAESYIKQYPSPLAIYPLRTALGFAFHFLLALGLALLLTASIRGFSAYAPLLSLLPTVLLLVVLGWSLAVIGGLVNVHFPDTSHLAEVGFQGLFYLTPIMFTKDLLREHATMQRFFSYNPLVFFLHLLRNPVLDGKFPASSDFLGAATMVLVVTAVAVFLLRRLEKRLIYHL
jgi:ABC-type polysaccharide/polyol phosphate export permease